MGVPRPGLLVGSSLMVLFAMLFLSLAVHWFSVMLLLLGLIGVGMAFVPDDPPAAVAPASPPPSPDRDSRGADLRQRLHALDQMLMDRVVSPVEHRHKRQQLLDAWALPPA